MSRLRSSNVWLVVVGVLIGSVLTPAAVIAAGQLVEITGPSGRSAEVTTARQLQVAEATPRTYYRGPTAVVYSNSGCLSFAAPPAGKALIIKSIRVHTNYNPNGGADFLAIYANPTCSTDFVEYFIPAGVGTRIIEYEPGLALAEGERLWASAGGMSAYVNAVGYEVSSGAVPASSPSRRRPPPPPSELAAGEGGTG